MRIRRVRLLLAVLAATAVGAASALASPAPGTFTTRNAWSFMSAPGLHPPKLKILGRASTRQLSRGDFLLASFPNLALPGPMTGQGGPLIVDRTLQPVWLSPVGTALVSADLQQETYQNQPVLVWWQGRLTATGATLRGQVVVVDQHYHRLASLRGQAPWVISLHDAVISGGDIWVTVYRSAPAQNLRPYGGKRHGAVYDAGVQEYDLKTGKLLYTWDALDHIPLAASEQPASVTTGPNGAWDAYHVNSIQVLPANRLLVSMRNTSAAYLIDTPTGQIIWTLGGKRSSFTFGRGASFAWQHDVALLAPNEVTLFDDACCRLDPGRRLGPTSGPSRGLVLGLDLPRRTARLIAAFPHRPPLDVLFLGSMQLLPGGNAVVGYGSLPYFSEYSHDGRQLLDVVFPAKDQSYRALFTSTWIGTPYYPPSGAVRRVRSRTLVYASWNGATQVARWRVLAGSAASRLSVVVTHSKTGFETTVSLPPGGLRYYQVQALDGRGRVLGTSRVFR